MKHPEFELQVAVCRYLSIKHPNVLFLSDTIANLGFVKQKLPSKIYKEFGAEKSKTIELPFLANLKIFARTEEINVFDANIYVSEEENDNLPF